MEFKYGRTLRENSFSPKHRPQPSPMKKDIFRRDLGLDDDDALPDMSSSSDEDSDGTQPSEIEFNIIQKELTTCTQQRDALRDKTEELQKTVQHLKSRLQKEEISKRSRMKMMQRTQADVLKDKQKLIEDLQDILEENGDSSSMKLVTNIEQLHKEKANLHAELMKAFDEYDTKMNEMEEKLRNAPHPIINGHNGDISQAISAEKENLEKKLLEVERQQSEEKTRNERLLKNKENEIGDLRHERDKLTDKVDTIENQMSDLKETIKQNERKLKKSEETSQKLIQEQTSQIESLESENNKLKRNVEVMQRESQSHASNQHNLDLQAHKLSDENQNLLVELKKCNKKIEDLERQSLELASCKSEVLEMKEENNELEIKLKRVGSSFDRHKATSKEKLRSVERDLEESRALMHQQRKEAAENYQELKRAMNRNEEQLKREIAESEEAFNEQKLESDKLIQRLEENLSKSKTKYSQVKEELTEVNSKLFSKLTECENMKEELETKGAVVIMTKQKLQESERVVEQKQVKIEELENKVGCVELEKENAQRQLQIMSGKSDSALAQKENETGNLRIQLNTLQNSLQAEKRKHESMAKVATEVQAKNTALEKQLCDQISKHRVEVESMVESQRVEMLKMKHDAEFATQSLTIKTKSLHKSIRQVTSVLHKLSHENTQLRREVETFPLLLQEGIKRAGKQISEALCEVNESSKDLVRRYRKEMKLRKKYHNELVELKGNIRVFRPLKFKAGKT
nr:restin homolog [Ciona intestinalis]|eukprot:XP_018672481.1 restin homolog [Ciona intestinalis]